ncbi:MAG: iron ABC transporter permease [Sulfurospirillum sp.]|nr:iron ABC transporter permease [Sulfurospirillum sp.]
MKLTGSNLSWLSITTGATLVVILPIILIVFYGLGTDGENLQHLKDTVLLKYIGTTAKLLLFVSILSLIFGIGSAFIVTFYEFRFQKTYTIGLVLPFVIPAYILGFIYSDIFGYYSYLHIFLMDLGFKNYFDVLNFNTVSFVLALALYPYIYLMVRASFLKNANTLLRPALSLGMSKEKALFRVVLPLNRVAIVGGLSLVLMETISEYGVVSYYGVDTLSTAVFKSWFDMGDSGSASYISSIAMIFILVILLIEKFSQGRARYTAESASLPFEKIKLKGIKAFFVHTFLSIPLLFGFVLPFIWIVNYTFKYAKERIDEEFFIVILNSFVASAFASFIIIILAVILAYTYRLAPSIYTKYINKFASLGYSMPGAVVAIGIIILFADFDHYLIENFGFKELLLSGTLFALVFGYVVRFLAVGLSSVLSSFEKVELNINKASRNLGKTPLQTLFQIELPLLKNSLIIAYILVFIDTIKELPLTLILRPFNYETLATKTYELAINEMVQESAVYAFCIILICFIPIIFNLKDHK